MEGLTNNLEWTENKDEIYMLHVVREFTFYK